VLSHPLERSLFTLYFATHINEAASHFVIFGNTLRNLDNLVVPVIFVKVTPILTDLRHRSTDVGGSEDDSLD
jgi:hypothetical protein